MWGHSPHRFRRLALRHLPCAPVRVNSAADKIRNKREGESFLPISRITDDLYGHLK